MSIDTSNWLWPQWYLIFWMFLTFTVACANHGKTRIQRYGDEEGKPQKHSAFDFINYNAVTIFIVVCGGFFK